MSISTAWAGAVSGAGRSARARRRTRVPARVAATASQAHPAASRYPPWLPSASTARPPSSEPSDTPTFSDVLIHASPSVSWEGATEAWTMLLPVVMVGAIAMPVVAMSAPSTTSPGASGRSEAPMDSAAVPARNCLHSGHLHERAP